KNLMEPDPTLLPEEPEVQARYDAGDLPEEIAQRFPASSLAWAMAAEDAWNDGRTLESYAYARVGYHRGLDSLRGAGWKGAGQFLGSINPIVVSYEPYTHWVVLPLPSVRPMRSTASPSS